MDALIAGDDARAKVRVSAFIESLGLRPLDTGGLEMARWLEGTALLLMGLARYGVGSFNCGPAPSPAGGLACQPVTRTKNNSENQITAKESFMSAFVFLNQLQAKDGQHDQLIELLREFAVSMHAEPGCIHYSLHVPVDGENGPVRVIQAYSSVEAFQEHAAWMGSNIPRLAELLEFPPQPPVLLEQVPLSGHPKESLSACSAAE